MVDDRLLGLHLVTYRLALGSFVFLIIANIDSGIKKKYILKK